MIMGTEQGNAYGRSCVIQHRSAALSSDFGMKMLRAKFPDADAILAELGTYSRGPRKGLPRGYVHWTKISEGGFDYEARIVRRPGTEDWRVMPDKNPKGRYISVAGFVKVENSTPQSQTVAKLKASGWRVHRVRDNVVHMVSEGISKYVDQNGNVSE